MCYNPLLQRLEGYGSPELGNGRMRGIPGCYKIVVDTSKVF